MKLKEQEKPKEPKESKEPKEPKKPKKLKEVETKEKLQTFLLEFLVQISKNANRKPNEQAVMFVDGVAER